MNYEGTNTYRYNGKEYESELGLNWYYYGARFYDPVLGRFPTVDPLSEYFHEQSTYAYADNNPATLIDFMGMGGEHVFPEAIITAVGNSGIHTVDLTWWDLYRSGSGGGSGDGGGSGGGWGGRGWGGGGGYGGGFSSGRGTFANSFQGNEVTVTAQRIPASVTATVLPLALTIAALDGPLPIGDIIAGGIISVAVTIDAYRNLQSSNEQDKKLTPGEIREIEEKGFDVHEIKGGKRTGQTDLYKNKNGDIIIKPKGGKGPGEPTGHNIKDLLK